MIVAAVVALVAVGIGGIALLGGRGGGGDAESSLVAAAQRATDAQAMRFEMSIEAGPVGPIVIEGAVDTAAGLMDMTMSADAFGVPGFDGTMAFIFDIHEEVMYMDVAAFGGALPTDASWVLMDFGFLAAASGVTLEEMRDQFVVDPADAVSPLLEEHDAVKVGTEEVDGETVDRYEVEIDLDEVLDASPQARAQFEELGSVDELPDTITYHVWVTHDDEIRRLEFEMPLGGDTLRTRFDMWQIDGDAGIELPRRGDVVDFLELLGG